jgi:hypothetical protein
VASLEFNIFLASFNFSAVGRRRGSGIGTGHATFNALVPSGAVETRQCACNLTFLASVTGFEFDVLLTGLDFSAVG